MKYPPARSAHWEGAVGQWLRGQLDARGIDAPAYGRYVLGLLTRPLDPIDADADPYDPYDPDDPESRRFHRPRNARHHDAIKRSAAVRCLLNASDNQDAEIERLVDELCSKLKQAEEGKGAGGKENAKRGGEASRRDRGRRPSPAEMARLYYAAFPALVPEAEPPPETRPAEPEPPRRRRRAPRPRPRTRGRRGRNAAEELPEWVNDGDVWDMDAHDPVKDEGYDTANRDDVEFYLSEALSGGPPVWKPPAEDDATIAEFEAKFDRSIEALWQDPSPSASERTLDRESPERPPPVSLTSSIWSSDGPAFESTAMDAIYDKLMPLNLEDSDREDSGGPLRPGPSDPSRSRGLVALNHDSARSSFTAVAPKAPSGCIGDNLRRRARPTIAKPPPPRDDDDDEDLLTSMRTHFRPIGSDEEEAPPPPPPTDVNYADGATFPIVCDLDSVKFSRSSSGSMFLESESSSEPPRRYMEYRKQGIDYSRLEICPSACSDDGLSSTDLILKFRVCQTEKSIQTEEGGPKTPSPETRPRRTDAEIFATLDWRWRRCAKCQGDDEDADRRAKRIWSSDDLAACEACSDWPAAFAAPTGRARDEDSAREWDELCSDLRYVHDLRLENEEDPIAPPEISFRADDGDFVGRAFAAQKRNEVMEDVRAWLIGAKNKIETNTVGKILDESLMMYGAAHSSTCSDSSKSDDSGCWRADRKRRHSAANNGIGKLRCTLPAKPFLPPLDRPLTR